MLDDFFNKLFKWLILIFFHFFFCFRSSKHSSHKYTSRCIFLLGENQVDVGLQVSTDGPGDKISIIQQLFFQGKNP